MAEVFIKKYWEEDGVLFYIHFNDGVAVRQIEISSTGTKYLSVAKPVNEESILYDQSLDQLSIEDKDLIAQEDFELIWKQE